jgi:hypothetical protein
MDGLLNNKALARSKHHHSQTKDKHRFKKKAAHLPNKPNAPATEKKDQEEEEKTNVEEGGDTYVPKYIRRALKSNAYRYEEPEIVEDDKEEWINMQKLLEGSSNVRLH